MKSEKEIREDVNFLEELQEELKTQDRDSQASPRFWVLRDYKWEVTAEGYHDKETIYFPEDNLDYDAEEFVRVVLENEDGTYTDDQIDSIKDVVNCGSDCSDIEEWIKDNTDAEVYICYEKEVPFIVPNTMFLTKAEAKKHIELNHYHYTDRVHTYAMTAWRAPKVERLLKILESFDWDSI
ncbi:MAG TPA: hypothetical protein GX707_10345 [Epulopiscium sp.]|nr:hypothetical protein [Candidatus Epulonipiscium sp.]